MTTLNQARPNREDMTWGAKGDLGGYMLTAEELERATAIVEKQSGYDLYTADQLSQQEIESAMAEYHMYKDMSAMAEQLDTLQAENNRLEATISGLQQIANLDEERIVALEQTVIRLGGRLHP